MKKVLFATTAPPPWRSAAWPRLRGSRSSATPAWVSATTSSTTVTCGSRVTTDGRRRYARRPARRLPRPLRRQHDRRDRQRHHLRRHHPRRQRHRRRGRREPDRWHRDDQGQTEGSVFVSGAWGTLTIGDTNGADEQWVGDLNEVGLTGLGCQNETFFFSNGGSFGGGDNVAAGDERPTIRYDYDIAGLRRVALVQPRPDRRRRRRRLQRRLRRRQLHHRRRLLRLHGLRRDFEERRRFDDAVRAASSGRRRSAASSASFSGKLIYTSPTSTTRHRRGVRHRAGRHRPRRRVRTPGRSTPTTSSSLDDASGIFDDVDGLQSYGVGATYDLGGGARIEGGVGSVWSISRRGRRLHRRRLRYRHGVLIPVNGTVRGKGGLRPAFSFLARPRPAASASAALRAPWSLRSAGRRAAAQGVALFGDARLGLGYNIDNDGERDRRRTMLRAISASASASR